MTISISEDKTVCGREAALKGSCLIRKILKEKGRASIILATGASQFEMLRQLVLEDLDWSKITVFHLDEYIGIPATHGASFRKYLKERFEEKVKDLKDFHYIQADAADLEGELKRLNGLISQTTIDVAFIGIGENGHIAFNDPPADFDVEDPYIVVDLDEACRRQQYGEGWFASLEDVPARAVSMSVKQIMKSTHIINTVPDARKADAVACSLNGEVSNLCPASILQTHASCFSFFDRDSAAGIDLAH